MIQIGDKIVSSELFEAEFICHLEKCHGSCCVIGDAGAPLARGEEKILEQEYDRIKAWITEKGREAIEEQGTWVVDSDGDHVTPLIDNNECAYTYFENGIAYCGIEKAWSEGRTKFRKPVSCHLYPIRVSKVGKYTALNYNQWGICEPARILGRDNHMPVFRFLKESIIRVYGEVFYRELENVYSELHS
jgi:hypothetical protein